MQIETLSQELQSYFHASTNTKERESQTDNQQYEKTIQINHKMKRIIQSFKDKIQHFVNENPQLFQGIGEDTNERLDHLISTLTNKQTEQEEIDQLKRYLFH